MAMFKDRDSDTIERIDWSTDDVPGDVKDEFGKYGISMDEKPDAKRGMTEMYESYLAARRQSDQRNGEKSYDDAREFYHHAPEVERPAPPMRENTAPRTEKPRARRSDGRQQDVRQSAGRQQSRQQGGQQQMKQRDMDLYLAAAREQGRREAESRAAVERAKRDREAEKDKRAAKKAAAENRKSKSSKASRDRGGSKSRGGKKKRGVGRIILILLLILVAAAGIFVLRMLGKVNKDKIDEKDLSIVPVDGYTNILLLGVDSRDMNDLEGARTDAIMILSINDETGEVSLTSIYRDTYLRMGGTDEYDKITHAHAYGGPAMVIKSLNEAMDLDIQDYVLFNFKGVADAIDALGGITLTIEEYEIEELNKYTIETAEIIGRDDYNLVTEPGEQVLDGCQAVSYGRIRKGVGDDFKRTERMRTVMKILMAEVRQMNAFELTNFASAVLPNCKTDISNKDLINLALKLKDADISGSRGFPYTVSEGSVDGVSYVMSSDLAVDVKEFHQTVFGQEEYEPSETVQEISYNASTYY